MLGLPQIVTLYGRRWDIEVFFKMAKSFLKLAKEIQSRSFDALVAHAREKSGDTILNSKGGQSVAFFSLVTESDVARVEEWRIIKFEVRSCTRRCRRGNFKQHKIGGNDPPEGSRAERCLPGSGRKIGRARPGRTVVTQADYFPSVRS
jgi:hypothetical protein